MVITPLLKTEKRSKFKATEGKLLTRFTTFTAKPSPKMPVITDKKVFQQWLIEVKGEN